ncbi:protein OSCP1 isoform X2 [Nothobranchius furzeri]|uniref:Transcript variant X1 n=1 Tax=Nothobranchius furzeri TaxID=105023 RepID=A0A9D2XBV1_NOTFU|nr:protein OSCP1 isoform X2 [Nothobranchius furzeri]KAF7199235.1 transcript variant X1 [Nothobranchius furzeri]
MSVRALPLVFINMGGEMLYVLDQRLRALNTSEEQSERGVWSEQDRRRVISDIIGTLFSKSFMDELLKPQPLYSHRTMKSVLTRLAHTSIMRLNLASMDRLYELMLMAFKHQVLLCPRPRDLLLVSYNHMDSMRYMVRDTPVLLNQVDETHRKLAEVYSDLSEGDFQLLRQTLLMFFQDSHIRVSLLLKAQIQKSSGRFLLTASGPVPVGTRVPGLIRMFDPKGREVSRSEYPSGGSYSGAVREGSLELNGDRVLKLGLNMYTMEHPEDTHTSNTPGHQSDNSPNPLAKEELNLLAHLMGSMMLEHVPKGDPGFCISFFSPEPEEEEGAPGGTQEFRVINIQAVQDEETTSTLAQIAGQFTDKEAIPGDESSSTGADLLAMMDDL